MIDLETFDKKKEQESLRLETKILRDIIAKSKKVKLYYSN